MKYMGSKSRVAKHIIPILQQCIDENSVTTYIEPFAGGLNVIDKIRCTHRYAYDINKYLISLWLHLQNGGKLLNEVPRELYNEVRANYQSGCYEDWYVGNVGFLASYNGRWFDGGYAQPGYEKTKNGLRYRDYYKEASNNILRQLDDIADVELKVMDYRQLNPSGAVIYCDPPYQGVKQYANSIDFDYDEFWDILREWSKNNFVFVSELNAPNDFQCLWTQEVSRSIKATDKSKAIEKLFKTKTEKRGYMHMSSAYISPAQNSDIKIANGNCLDLMKKLPDEYIDLLITDPPYKMTSRGNSGTTGGMLKKKITMTGEVFKHNDIDCTEYAPEFYRLLKDGSHCYIMTNHINLIHMLNTFTDVGFHFIKSIIWDKGNKIMGRFYMSQYEYILFFRKGKGVQINNCGTSDILSIKNAKTKGEDGKNLHDTEKPVELMETLVENSSQPGQIVLDPFMGIGATGLACMKTNRKFIGYELDENYFNIATERIINYGKGN